LAVMAWNGRWLIPREDQSTVVLRRCCPPRAMAFDPFVHAQITCVEWKGERLETWRIELGVVSRAEAERHAESSGRV
jgi:hypothetical protein